LLAGTIEITRKFRVFDESAAVEQRREVFTRDEMVLDAVKFSWPWGACCVWRGGYGTRLEAKKQD
jgi:hypothetical protein